MMTCYQCRESPAQRYYHWLTYPTQPDFVDHLRENGVSKEHISAHLAWWQTVRSQYSEMVDEGNNRLTVAQAWQRAQNEAHAQQYTVNTEASAQAIRDAYWETHDPFLPEKELVAAAFAEIQGAIVHGFAMGQAQQDSARHTAAEIAAYVREQQGEEE